MLNTIKSTIFKSSYSIQIMKMIYNKLYNNYLILIKKIAIYYFLYFYNKKAKIIKKIS